MPDSYRSKTTPADHIASFYRRWTELRDEPFDGLVVTGAPVETLAFEEVDYRPALRAIFDWAQSRRIGNLHICWTAQAALYHFHDVPKHPLSEKMFGVFGHRVTGAGARLLQGFGATFPVPVSRHTEVRAADLPAEAGLIVLAASAEAGLCLVEDTARRAVFMFNHLEYDTGTLAEEFRYDRKAGKPISIPRNYFPNDDPSRPPVNAVLRAPAVRQLAPRDRSIARRGAESRLADGPSPWPSPASGRGDSVATVSIESPLPLAGQGQG